MLADIQQLTAYTRHEIMASISDTSPQPEARKEEYKNTRGRGHCKADAKWFLLRTVLVEGEPCPRKKVCGLWPPPRARTLCRHRDAEAKTNEQHQRRQHQQQPSENKEDLLRQLRKTHLELQGLHGRHPFIVTVHHLDNLGAVRALAVGCLEV